MAVGRMQPSDGPIGAAGENWMPRPGVATMTLPLLVVTCVVLKEPKPCPVISIASVAKPF